MNTTITIPIGNPGDVRTGALTLRKVAACPDLEATVDGDGFRIAALVVFEIDVDDEGEDFVEVRRTRGEPVAVEAGQVVVVQVETANGGGSAATLRLRGTGWTEVEAHVVVGQVRTTPLVKRRTVAPGRAVSMPIRIQTLGCESTTVQYELAEPVPGIVMLPQTVQARAGVDALGALVFETTGPRALGAVTVRVLATAFGGMQREVLAPMTLIVTRRHREAPAAPSVMARRLNRGRS